MSKRNPFATKADGSAVDPRAFREALMKDSGKMLRLQNRPELKEVVEKGSDAELQRQLRTEFTADMQDRGPLELSREVMRARGRFPLDVVALYKGMNEMGLNYGNSGIAKVTERIYFSFTLVGGPGSSTSSQN